MRLPISVKLMATFAVLLLIMGFQSAYSIHLLATLNQGTAAISDNWLPGVEVLGNLQTRIEHVQTLTYKFITVNDPDQMASVEAELNSTWAAIHDLRVQYEQHLSSATERELYPQLEPLLDKWQGVQGRILGLARINLDEKASSIWAIEGRAAVDPAIKLLEELKAANTAGSLAARKDGAALYVASRTYFILLAGVAVLLGLTLALAQSRAISRGLRRVATAAASVARGDLTVEEVKHRSRDEVGDLAESFNAMLRNLRDVIREVIHSSQAVASSAEQLSGTTDQVAQAAQGVARAMGEVTSGATTQANGLSETDHMMEELRSTLTQIAEGAQEQACTASGSAVAANRMAVAIQEVVTRASDVAASAQQARVSAGKGCEVVAQTVDGMARVRSAVLDAAEQLKEVGRLSEQIGVITQVITDIASQTNVLALNGAIEAARAGEHGAGFAVVAGEVRQLAVLAGNSAQQIEDVIRNIRKGTLRAIDTMDQGQLQVEKGAQLANDAGQALREILSDSERVAGAAALIAASAQQIEVASGEVVSSIDRVAAIGVGNMDATQAMAANAERVTRSVTEVASITSENSAAAEEVLAAMEEMQASMNEVAGSAASLGDIAKLLDDQVCRFKLAAGQ